MMVQKLNLERQAAEESGVEEDHIQDSGHSDVSASLLPSCLVLPRDCRGQKSAGAAQSRRYVVQKSSPSRAAEPRSGLVAFASD